MHCLGGVYTSDFLDFASIDTFLLALFDIPVGPGEPLHDLPVLQHLLHQNSPFKASFRNARRDMIFRNCYNNHHSSDPYLSSTHDKSPTEIKKSYSIALPQWTLQFVSKLFLAALCYATCTHKGKIKGR